MRPPRQKRLPRALSREECRRLIEAISRQSYRLCCWCMYALGLRLSEALGLRPESVDSKRMLVRVVGKRNRERVVPLPGALLVRLRDYWRTHRSGHPHVHMLASGAGATADGSSWRKVRSNFLVPVKKLSPLVARRFREALEKERPELLARIPSQVWQREWCSFCRPLGQHSQAVMRYLGRYVYRVAITRSRILAMDDAHVTFRYKDSDTGRWQTCCIPGVEFVRRFLLHVLPKGFHKVRYFGLWHSSRRGLLGRLCVKLQLSARPGTRPIAQTMAELAAEALAGSGSDSQAFVPQCPKCASRNVRLVAQLRRGARPQAA